MLLLPFACLVLFRNTWEEDADESPSHSFAEEDEELPLQEKSYSKVTRERRLSRKVVEANQAAALRDLTTATIKANKTATSK